MPKCHHDHHTPQRADKWTNIATAGEATASLISDAYWLATLFDIASGCEVQALGLSFYAIGFGVFMASFSAGGAAAAHRALNTHHQPKPSGEEKASREDGKTQPVSIQTAQHGHHHATPHAHHHLTKLQKLSLVGDFISHTGDIAGPLTFVINLASNNGLPRWGKALAQCGASLFGSIATVANVRTCKDAMMAVNEQHHHEQTPESPLLNQ